jgi:hypothetical protein
MMGASGKPESLRLKGWEEIRAERMRSAEARAGYGEARRAFQVGELVRKARTESGLTQSALAERVMQEAVPL